MKPGIWAAVLLCVAGVSVPSAQPARFDDVIRNLRNPDPNIRLSAVRLLREAKYPEAIVPIAPLANDPVEAIQLEAIAAELSFFLVQDLQERRRRGLLIEVRNRGAARAAFDLGPLAVWPRQAPPELILELLKATNAESRRVRLEAVYAVGVIGSGPLTGAAVAGLVAALDHYDPAVRAGAARVAGRLDVRATGDALLKAVNDSDADVRYAAMRALGMIRDERAVRALTEQLDFYGKGEGAWSALDGLARIAHPASIPVFTSRLTDRDPNLRRAAAEGLGRAGDASAKAALEAVAASDESRVARAAAAYALQKLGENYLPRLVEFLDDRATARQVQDYLLDLGAPIERELLTHLQEPDGALLAAVADVLGGMGGDASVAALQSVSHRDRVAIEAVERALDRIKMRRAL